MVFCVLMSFSDADDQVAFHPAEFGIFFFLHFFDRIVAFHRNPWQVGKFFLQLLSQLVGKAGFFKINCFKFHEFPFHVSPGSDGARVFVIVCAYGRRLCETGAFCKFDLFILRILCYDIL